MTADEFATGRQPIWAEFEGAIRRARRGRLRTVTASDLERFGLLYRHATSDLAIARRDFPEDAVTRYLNSLCARAHPLLYRGSPPRLSKLFDFYATGVPRAFRAATPYVLASLALMLAGGGAGWLAVELRPDLRASLVPNSLFDQMARGMKGNVPDPGSAAGFIIQNNIRVALICFVAGVAAGLPTAFLLLVNGWTLGTLAAAVHEGGYDFQFWSLIAPHGVLELSIIVIAGATGLMLGDAVLRPGLLRRTDALAAGARRAIGLVLGVATLLIAAGLTEGFVSPSDLPAPVKIAWGVGLGTGFYSWLLLGGRTRAALRRFSVDAAADATPATPSPTTFPSPRPPPAG